MTFKPTDAAIAFSESALARAAELMQDNSAVFPAREAADTATDIAKCALHPGAYESGHLHTALERINDDPSNTNWVDEARSYLHMARAARDIHMARANSN